jgi:hypothetical protein
LGGGGVGLGFFFFEKKKKKKKKKKKEKKKNVLPREAPIYPALVHVNTREKVGCNHEHNSVASLCIKRGKVGCNHEQ